MENNHNFLEELYCDSEKYGLVNATKKLFGPRGKLKINFKENICKVPVEEITLSMRGYNSLKRNGLNTLGDVIDAISGGDIMRIRNLGRKTACEIKMKITNYAYSVMSEKEKKEFLKNIIDINLK